MPRRRPLRSALPAWRSLACRLGMVVAAGLAYAAPCLAAELPEHRVKAAFLYNFMLFTEWPAEAAPTLQLCLLGDDPFAAEIDTYEGKAIGARKLTVVRLTDLQRLRACHLVYISPGAVANLPRVLDRLKGSPVLTVADSPEAARQGVAINMVLVQSRVAFEVNRKAVLDAGLTLSSKLLRLAREVF